MSLENVVFHRQVEDNFLQGAIMRFQPVSLTLALRDLVSKITDAVGEAFLRLRALFPISMSQEQTNRLTALTQEQPNIQAVIARIRKFQRLGASAFIEYKSIIEAENPNVLLYTDFLTVQREENGCRRENFPELPSLFDQGSEGKRLFLIPLVLEGHFEDHIVLFAYDAHNSKGYYYDSKGKPVKASENRFLKNLNFTLGDFFQGRTVRDGGDQVADSVVNIYSDMQALYENTCKHQHNFTDCGVYVFQKIRDLTERLGNPGLTDLNHQQACKELVNRDPVAVSSAQGRKEVLQAMLKKKASAGCQD